MSSNDPHLPFDALIDIFLRLSVKTLMRLRCVCKSWYSLITHPTFITTHLNRASSHTADYIQYIKARPHEKQIWCFLYDDTYVNRVEMEIPFNHRYECRIVSSLNGLVCLYEGFFCNIIFLWNPSIRKRMALPSSSINDMICSILGFGFHSQTNDYRVVKIAYFKDSNGIYDPDSPPLNLPPLVEVYSLTTDSWRKIKTHVPGFMKLQERGVFINGSVHWLASTSNLKVYKCSDMIMLFDFGDEVFREIMLPINCSAQGSISMFMSLAVLKESLSLCVSSRFSAYSSTCIWFMKEYGVVESWTKQFTVVLGHVRVERCLGFTNNNELLLQMSNRDLISYDTESLQYKNLGRAQNEWNVATFVETLVLLDRQNALLGQDNSVDGFSCEGIHIRRDEDEVEHNLQLQVGEKTKKQRLA